MNFSIKKLEAKKKKAKQNKEKKLHHFTNLLSLTLKNLQFFFSF